MNDVGTVLASSGSCTFDITEEISGNYGDSHTNIFTAVAVDDEGNEASNTDSETIRFTDYLPTITVDKSANVSSI